MKNKQRGNKRRSVINSSGILLFLLHTACSVEAGTAASTLSFTVANSVPTVGGVACSQDGYLVSCKATLSDLNGRQDLVGCNGTLGSGDNLDAYLNSSCMLYGGFGNEEYCVCSFQLKSVEEGEWTVYITARDYETSGVGEGTVSTNFYDTSWLAFRLDSSKIQGLAGLLGLS